MELDRLALAEGPETLHSDRGLVDEQIVAAIVGDDEAEPLLVIEPLHGTAQPLTHLFVFGFAGKSSLSA